MNSISQACLQQEPFHDFISPLTYDDRGIFESFFRADTDPYRYENSWAFITLFAKDERHKYYDGNTLFSFSRDHVTPNTITITRPMGVNANNKALMLARSIFSNGIGDTIVIRYLSKSDSLLFQENGFQIVQKAHPQPVIHIPSVVALKGNSWEKIRLRLNRFNSYYKASFIDINENNIHSAYKALDKWRHTFIDRYGNQAERPPVTTHYEWLLERSCSIIDNTNMFGFMMECDSNIVGLCVASSISTSCIATYLNITTTNINGSAEVLLHKLSVRALQNGYTWLNLGHSDLDGLHRYKLKYNPVLCRDTFSAILKMS